VAQRISLVGRLRCGHTAGVLQALHMGGEVGGAVDFGQRLLQTVHLPLQVCELQLHQGFQRHLSVFHWLPSCGFAHEHAHTCTRAHTLTHAHAHTCRQRRACAWAHAHQPMQGVGTCFCVLLYMHWHWGQKSLNVSRSPQVCGGDHVHAWGVRYSSRMANQSLDKAHHHDFIS
jgi:hypothetical protein